MNQVATVLLVVLGAVALVVGARAQRPRGATASAAQPAPARGGGSSWRQALHPGRSPRASSTSSGRPSRRAPRRLPRTSTSTSPSKAPRPSPGRQADGDAPDCDRQEARRRSASRRSTARRPSRCWKRPRPPNIPVIGFDSGVDSDIPVTTAATDNIAAAAAAADKMAELIGDAGKVAIIAHDQTSRTGIDRVKGFTDQIKAKYPNIKIVEHPVRRRRPAQVHRHRQGHHPGQPGPEGLLRRQRRFDEGRA